ncbi:Aste57867_3520 [Aphanomyces stellatus]|uniref:Aste57867_3520 protein n=1 Tax=Aphanomyces stellatus TaxID=120398 RepID=A0A485K9V0_9STRA|nr:hypothetical protein As57867_003509 [Aphanomyces stellatus]VFT80683.1 Aste57867_3520 [Aphanomyces stellatus]
MVRIGSSIHLIALASAAAVPSSDVPSLVCSPLELDTVYHGFELTNLTAVEYVDECCDACLATPLCTIFVYHESTCFLKTNAGPVEHGVTGALSSFRVPDTPAPTAPPLDDSTEAPMTTTLPQDYCRCVGGPECSTEGQCNACNMYARAGGRVCDARHHATCRWYGGHWCGGSEPPTLAPPTDAAGRCECASGNKCELEWGQCSACNYPHLSDDQGNLGVCEDWERNACLHTFGGQWCSGL